MNSAKNSYRQKNLTARRFMAWTVLMFLLWNSEGAKAPTSSSTCLCSDMWVVEDDYSDCIGWRSNTRSSGQPLCSARGPAPDRGVNTTTNRDWRMCLNTSQTTKGILIRDIIAFGTWDNQTEDIRLMNNGSILLLIGKSVISTTSRVITIVGTNCTDTLKPLLAHTTACPWFQNSTGNCTVTCTKTSICNHATYDATYCNRGLFPTSKTNNDQFIVNTSKSEPHCYNCNNPVKKPDQTLQLKVTVASSAGAISSAVAAEVMKNMSSIVSMMTGSSAEVNFGSVKGVVVKQDQEALGQVSFGYTTPTSNINIVEDPSLLPGFSRSVSVSKQAFEQALLESNSTAFAGVFRFVNMSKDEKNSTVLYNEVLAIEMGAIIRNLTDKISIHFANVDQSGIPSCQSWDGQGAIPNWTTSGCRTILDDKSFTCSCSHLTFFAVLMSPPNTTISTADLNSLTYITNIGCGLSLLFLCIALFMHFLIRKTKANTALQILMQLFMAMILLNFTFLINEQIAGLNNQMGCQAMAAIMHYSMLATFTWFAVEAFHICLQLYTGKITIKYYILKVSTVAWVLPGVVVIIFLALNQYGEQFIYTNLKTVTICWISDSSLEYKVNIGYYAVVFLFTFTTFIIIMRWLFLLKRNKMATGSQGGKGMNILSIFSLCCMLGLTWGFAFFAYGSLQLPALYIFTILNSSQGLFMFIFYYKTGSGNNRENPSNSSKTSVSNLYMCENPYNNMAAFKPQ